MSLEFLEFFKNNIPDPCENSSKVTSVCGGGTFVRPSKKEIPDSWKMFHPPLMENVGVRICGNSLVHAVN